MNTTPARDGGAGGARSRVVLVLGMHRSGTSAVTGALARCGVALGDHLIEGAADNPAGYFEHADAVRADDELLLGIGRAWDDVRSMPDDWLASSAAARARDAIESGVVAELRGTALWGLKDPRMCRLLPLWLLVIESVDVEPSGLLVLRHPDEVAASLARRDSMHPRAANLLWLRHVLEAAQYAPARSTAITYDDFLADAAGTLARSADALGVSLAIEPHALAAFVDHGARHHRAMRVERQDDVHALALDAYDALSSAGWRRAVPELLTRLGDIDEAHAGWIDAVGAAAFGAEHRRRIASEAQLAAERRAEQLQAAVDHASELANDRVAELASLDERNRALQDALGRAESLVVERSREAAALQQQLQEASTGLARAEALAVEREAAMRELDQRVAAGERALREAEALLRGHSSRIVELEAAKVAAESIADERLQLIARLETAKSLAESIAEERLQLIARLETAKSLAESIADERLQSIARLETAKAAAETMALDRLASNHALERALSEAEQLAVERLAALETLDAEAERRRHAIGELMQRVAELEVPAQEMARLRSSRLWPLVARLLKTGKPGV
ncbi:MAG TPA: hypothetical protein VIG54_00785 [Lysobacter sp.]